MFEVENLPKCHAEIQQSEAGDGAAHPARRHHVLQPIESGFAGGVEEKIVVAPITQAEEALGNPRQQRQHNADFQAKDDVKNNAQFGGHEEIVSSQ